MVSGDNQNATGGCPDVRYTEMLVSLPQRYMACPAITPNSRASNEFILDPVL